MLAGSAVREAGALQPAAPTESSPVANWPCDPGQAAVIQSVLPPEKSISPTAVEFHRVTRDCITLPARATDLLNKPSLLALLILVCSSHQSESFPGGQRSLLGVSGTECLLACGLAPGLGW